MDYTCHDIAKMIDHSLLRPELTEGDIRKGCEIAIKYDVATVCCSPSDLALVVKLLAGSDVKPTTVIGFPHGYNTIEVKRFEAEQAIKDGAVELDMVLNISKLLSGDYDYVKKDIEAVVEVAHAHNVPVKVIFENFYLTDEQKIKACKLSEEAGVDFVKTSSGFAGDAAIKVREIGCTRFGATRTEGIMEECFKRQHR
jgi:deoxyribose-phosphate aldolase